MDKHLVVVVVMTVIGIGIEFISIVHVFFNNHDLDCFMKIYLVGTEKSNEKDRIMEDCER